MINDSKPVELDETIDCPLGEWAYPDEDAATESALSLEKSILKKAVEVDLSNV